jgi:acyl carrier protein
MTGRGGWVRFTAKRRRALIKMNREEIRAKIQELLREVVDDETVVLTDESTADDVKGWDSTNHVRLMIALESAFNIRFETDEIIAPESVGELVSLIQGKL